MREQELKWKLSSVDDYQRVCRNLPGFIKEIQQTNVYLDTHDRHLMQHSTMLRLRQEDIRSLVTVKSRSSHEEGYFVADEWERDLETWESDLILDTGTLPGDIEGILRQMIADIPTPVTVQKLGELSNTRRIHHLDGLVIEVDCTQITHQLRDFEIEIETDAPDRARAYLEKFCAQYDIHTTPQTLTKYERFLQATTAP